jgi:nucleoside 2-deoxyribosyltransferase
MSYAARVFRVLIASPSDVSEEREIAVGTIQAWNDLNSSERQLVLLPLRWETHSAPEYGRQPQEILNRQVVDHADLLVGVFWTRIGSPTDAADSGTLEEIERVASKGKPVMLYFSQVKQDPDRIDLEQLKRLREFKTKTFPRALIETFTTQIEFRDKLSKQLEIQLRTLIAEESQSESDALVSTPVTDIQFEFAEPETGAKAGTHLQFESSLIRPRALSRIPDYDPPTQKVDTDDGPILFVGSQSNKEYYRDTVRYFINRSLFRPVRFWLKNIGGIGAGCLCRPED